MPEGSTAISCRIETHRELKADKLESMGWDEYLLNLREGATIVSAGEVATLSDVKAAVREGRGDE